MPRLPSSGNGLGRSRGNPDGLGNEGDGGSRAVASATDAALARHTAARSSSASNLTRYDGGPGAKRWTLEERAAARVCRAMAKDIAHGRMPPGLQANSRARYAKLAFDVDNKTGVQFTQLEHLALASFIAKRAASMLLPPPDARHEGHGMLPLVFALSTRHSAVGLQPQDTGGAHIVLTSALMTRNDMFSLFVDAYTALARMLGVYSDGGTSEDTVARPIGKHAPHRVVLPNPDPTASESMVEVDMSLDVASAAPEALAAVQHHAEELLRLHVFMSADAVAALPAELHVPRIDLHKLFDPEPTLRAQQRLDFAPSRPSPGKRRTCYACCANIIIDPASMTARVDADVPVNRIRASAAHGASAADERALAESLAASCLLCAPTHPQILTVHPAKRPICNDAVLCKCADAALPRYNATVGLSRDGDQLAPLDPKDAPAPDLCRNAPDCRWRDDAPQDGAARDAAKGQPDALRSWWSTLHPSRAPASAPREHGVQNAEGGDEAYRRFVNIVGTDMGIYSPTSTGSAQSGQASPSVSSPSPSPSPSPRGTTPPAGEAPTGSPSLRDFRARNGIGDVRRQRSSDGDAGATPLTDATAFERLRRASGASAAASPADPDGAALRAVLGIVRRVRLAGTDADALTQARARVARECFLACSRHKRSPVGGIGLPAGRFGVLLSADDVAGEPALSGLLVFLSRAASELGIGADGFIQIVVAPHTGISSLYAIPGRATRATGMVCPYKRARHNSAFNYIEVPLAKHFGSAYLMCTCACAGSVCRAVRIGATPRNGGTEPRCIDLSMQLRKALRDFSRCVNEYIDVLCKSMSDSAAAKGAAGRAAPYGSEALASFVRVRLRSIGLREARRAAAEADAAARASAACKRTASAAGADAGAAFMCPPGTPGPAHKRARVSGAQ